jgi:hypothetical protein
MCLWRTDADVWDALPSVKTILNEMNYIEKGRLSEIKGQSVLYNDLKYAYS